jgi:2-dehydro-3-deoxygluconokinase
MNSDKKKINSPQIISVGDCLILMNPTKTGSLRYVKKFEKEWAGAEANMLVGCSRLGISTGLIGSFAKDPFGRMIYHDLKGEAVDLSQLQWDAKRATPLFFKERRSGGEFAVYYYRTNTAGSFVDFQEINPDYFSDTKIFFCTGIFPALSSANKDFLQKTIELARKKGAMICFDPNIRLKLFENTAAIKKLILPFLEQADLVLISHNEAELLFDTQVPELLFEKFAKQKMSTAVLKQGENGSVGWDRKQIIKQKPIAVDVLDTCGAGDSYNAGFLYGYLQKFSLAESMELGAHCASFAVNSYSDNENAPTLEELLAQKNKTKKIDR